MHMTVTRTSIACFALATLGWALTAVTMTRAQSTHPVVPADKVQFAPAPPFLPAGAQLAVLEGNPSAKGAVTLRLKLPANYVIPPHWHSMDERVTVISGAFHVGMGDTLDRPGSTTLEQGGFVSLKANMHHFGWTATPTVVQINLDGPFDIFYVNASEDPQKSTKH
jgi:hypothetical protein